MKIEGPEKPLYLKGAAKTTGKKAEAGGFSAFVEEGAAETQASPTSSIGNLNALLLVQEVEDLTAEARAKKAKRRGTALLDALQRLKLQIIEGAIPRETLSNLQRMVSQEREVVMDPQLKDVLDEIDLRVQVEIAKFQTR